MQPNTPYQPDPYQPQGGVQPLVPQAQPPQPYGPPPQQPQYPPNATPPTPQPREYEFIMNPPEQKKPLKIPGAGSLIGRIALVVVGLIVLLMIFTVLKGIFTHKPDLTPFVGIAQDQQELIHLASDAGGRADITQANKNFAVTARLSVSTDQSQILSYLQSNGVKFNPKTFPTLLNARIDNATEDTLSQASTNNTYNPAFHDVIQQKLVDYGKDLKAAYLKTKGPTGHQLLNDDYDVAQKLVEQLNNPAN